MTEMWKVALLVVFLPSIIHTEEVTLDAEVLILGAGMSGISAAHTLSQNNISNFIILEAEGRIGGRVKSEVLEHTGVRIELGANWIQGVDPVNPDKHPLWHIAGKCGGLEGEFVKDFNSGTMHVYDESGKNITLSNDFRDRLAFWNKALDPGLPVYSIQRQKAGLPDINIRDSLRYLGWIPGTPLDDLIEWYGFDLDEMATSPENISLYNSYPTSSYDDFGNPNRTENYFVTDQKVGFEKVVQCLAKQFLSENDKRLVLNSIVQEIHWNDSANYACVNVTQFGRIKQYCANYVIPTFSLGVLQSDSVKFVPSLPPAKIAAINSCPFVLYLKIFLEFDTIFWKNDTNVDNFLHVDKWRGHYVQFQPVRESLPILFTTVTDEMAKRVYEQSIDDVTDEIMKVLRLIYGEDTPNPVHVTVPDWWTNPLFKGMYTVNSVGCGENVANTLSEPVGNMYFGGAATSYEFSGFLHGAYFAGIDVANKVVAKIKPKL